MKNITNKLVKYLPAAAALATAAVSSDAFAQAATGTTTSDAGLKAIGAGLALGLGAVGTGLAQGPIGAAAAGVTAERPEKFGQMAIWFFIPETLVIFGFVGFFLLK
ncbi:V-type ATP synthase subunit K [Deinococcus sp.]|uniref:V-type ATP synthase subunit K n=1 Tax=Deinococcus sp. TaxID=47478 RepID=UPI00286DC162|nr:V-type ATP synthase subunit K [Deinococcus sp.]